MLHVLHKKASLQWLIALTLISTQELFLGFLAHDRLYSARFGYTIVFSLCNKRSMDRTEGDDRLLAEDLADLAQAPEPARSRMRATIIQDRQARRTAEARNQAAEERIQALNSRTQATVATAQSAVMAACRLLRTQGRYEEAAKCDYQLHILTELSAVHSTQVSNPNRCHRSQHAQACHADSKYGESVTTGEGCICDYSFMGGSNRAAPASKCCTDCSKHDGLNRSYKRELTVLWFQIGLLSALSANGD